MQKVKINDMAPEEIGEAVDRALTEVHAEYAAGTLDLSGRYYTDEELAEMRALGTYYIAKKPKAAGTAA